jgi:alpha-ketoglutarate-dependent taurine dioxygenase
MSDIAGFADQNKVSISWKKGDFMILDNEMVKHSREPFSGKNRRVMAMLFKGERKTTE